MAAAILELAGKRASCRAFTADPVPPEAVREILATAIAAPSSGNLQAFEIVAVSTPRARAELSRAAYGQAFIHQAPMVLVFIANPVRSQAKYQEKGEQYAIQDATIAATWAQLAAEALGFGTCMVGGFDLKAVQQVVGDYICTIPAVMLCIGKAAEPGQSPPRRSVESVVHDEKLEYTKIAALWGAKTAFEKAKVHQTRTTNKQEITVVIPSEGEPLVLQGHWPDEAAKRVALAEALRKV